MTKRERQLNIEDIISWLKKAPLKYVSIMVRDLQNILNTSGEIVLECVLREMFDVQLYWLHKELKYLCNDCRPYHEDETRLEVLIDNIDDMSKIDELISSKWICSSTLVLFFKYIMERLELSVVPEQSSYMIKLPYVTMAMIEHQPKDVVRASINQLIQFKRQDKISLFRRLDYLDNSLSDILYALSNKPEYTVEKEYYIKQLKEKFDNIFTEDFVKILDKLHKDGKTNIILNIMQSM